MADWTNLPNQAVGVGGLPSGTTVTALRDNPVAIAQGAAGAPRVQTAAIQNGAVNASKLATGNSERDWVLARTAGASAGAVGTYAFLGGALGENSNFGQTRAGSQLNPVGIVGLNTFLQNGFVSAGTSFRAQSVSLSGTWRCMGIAFGGSGASGASLWIRIS